MVLYVRRRDGDDGGRSESESKRVRSSTYTLGRKPMQDVGQAETSLFPREHKHVSLGGKKNIHTHPHGDDDDDNI